MLKCRYLWLSNRTARNSPYAYPCNDWSVFASECSLQQFLQDALETGRVHEEIQFCEDARQWRRGRETWPCCADIPKVTTQAAERCADPWPLIKCIRTHKCVHTFLSPGESTRNLTWLPPTGGQLSSVKESVEELSPWIININSKLFVFLGSCT